jgi:lipoate-protein ligase A
MSSDQYISNQYGPFQSAFVLAAENMAEDERISNQFAAQVGPQGEVPKGAIKRIVRVYTWQHAGLTINKDKELPHDLEHYDVSPRPTGGGIVFHAPGDVLFTLVFAKHDPAFPKALKEKTNVISATVQRALNTLDIQTKVTCEDKGGCVSAPSAPNLQFCKTYDTPFELSVDDEKICGITLKRYRTHFLVQGILHVKSNIDAFPDISQDYRPFLTSGMSHLNIDSTQLRDVLFEQFQELFSR